MSRSVSAPSSVTNTSPCWYGDIVPGSTLMYGSNFWSWTERPRATSRRPIDAAAMPLPSEETTPPVTKMKRVRDWAGDVMLAFRSSLDPGNLPLSPDGSGKPQNAVGDGRRLLLGEPVGAVDPLDRRVVGVLL